MKRIEDLCSFSDYEYRLFYIYNHKLNKESITTLKHGITHKDFMTLFEAFQMEDDKEKAWHMDQEFINGVD